MLPLLGPTLQDGRDIGPTSFVLGHGDLEGIVNPLPGVEVFGFLKVFGQHGRDGADVVFVQGKNVRVSPRRFVGRFFQGNFTRAGLLLKESAVGGGVDGVVFLSLSQNIRFKG